MIESVVRYEQGYAIRVSRHGEPLFYFIDYDERSYELNMEFQHFHDFYEIHILLDRSAAHIIEGSLYEIQPFDIVLEILFLPYSKENLSDLEQRKSMAIEELNHCLYPIVQEKRAHPTNDVISTLAQVEYKGEKFTDQEVITGARNLLSAGKESMTQLISNMFYCMLFDQPGIYRELRADLSLVPNLIEEVLRFRFPVVGDRRVARDTDVFGHKMKEGQSVVVWISAANRDESRFADAEVFHIHRKGNEKHLAFGVGAHFCLGAPLARMEANIAMTTFLKRFADIHPAEPFNLTEHLQDGVVGQSLKSLPIQLTKA